MDRSRTHTHTGGWRPRRSWIYISIECRHIHTSVCVWASASARLSVYPSAKTEVAFPCEAKPTGTPEAEGCGISTRVATDVRTRTDCSLMGRIGRIAPFARASTLFILIKKRILYWFAIKCPSIIFEEEEEKRMIQQELLDWLSPKTINVIAHQLLMRRVIILYIIYRFSFLLFIEIYQTWERERRFCRNWYRKVSSSIITDTRRVCEREKYVCELCGSRASQDRVYV